MKLRKSPPRSGRAIPIIASSARRPASSKSSRTAARRPTPRLGVCLYLLGRYSDAVETLAHSDGGALTHFYLGKVVSGTGSLRRGTHGVRVGRAGRLFARSGGAGQGRGAALQQPRARSTRRAQPLVRRRGADGRVSVSTRGDRFGAGRQSERSRRAVGAGRRRRRQPCRRPVRPGAGKRSPRQRHLRPRFVRAGRHASFPRTSARC